MPMDAETKALFDEQAKTFEAFKAANDALGEQVKKLGEDAVTKDEVKKISDALDKFEAANQKVTTELVEAKKKADEAAELKGQIDKLELKLQRPQRADPEERKAALKDRVNLWGRAVVDANTKGVVNLSEDQRKVLDEIAAEAKSMSVTDDTTGGYLAPAEYVQEIIRGVTLASPIRSLVRVRQTTSKSIMLPKRVGQFAAQRVAEQGTRGETTGLKFGMVEINAPEMFALIDISQQNLEDSAFDLEAELTFEATEQFAVKEGAEGVSGSGVGECEGVLTNSDVAFTVSGSATTIADSTGQADGILRLKYDLKAAYARNATWGMNRTVLGSIRRLKDNDKQYIWQPGLGGQPNTIDGDPYVELPDMPNEGAGTYPIAYGDWSRAYTMVDRIAMTMLRDPYTQATSGNIRFLFRRRVGGAVVLAEAIRKLKCST